MAAMLRRAYLLMGEVAWYYGVNPFDAGPIVLDEADDGDVEARLAALNEWFFAEGGVGDVEVRLDAYSGRCGLYATAAIEQPLRSNSLAACDVYLYLPLPLQH